MKFLTSIVKSGRKTLIAGLALVAGSAALGQGPSPTPVTLTSSNTVFNPQVIFTGTTAQFSGTDGTQTIVSVSNNALQLLSSGSGGITLITGTNVGAITSTGTGGTSYAYLNGGQIGYGVDPAACGALANGTDDSGAFNAAESYCVTSGRPLTLRPGATYTIGEPITWYCCYSSIIGNGAKIISTSTNSAAILISSTNGLDSRARGSIINANRYEINGLELQGAGYTSTNGTFYANSGIVMGDSNASGTTSAANVVIRNCSIHNFDVGVNWAMQQNSYLQKFENDQIGGCNYCVYSDTTGILGGLKVNVG